jgi:methionyl aminopeptidase
MTSQIYGINPVYSTEFFLDETSRNNEELENLIKSTNIHKKVKQDLILELKPKMKLIDIANFIEKSIEKYSPNQLNLGKAFPVGLSLNNCAAHYTPKIDDPTLLTENDVLKIDYGVHYNGIITDSAFTISYNPKYEEFLKISRNTTNYGVKNLKLDMNIGDWGELIQEYVTSKEVEIDNKIYQLKTIKELTGHNILPYQIHGGVFLPSFRLPNYNKKVTKGCWAVEIFVTTGSGESYYDETNNTHYNLNLNNNEIIRLDKVNKMKNYLKNTFRGLPFTEKWVRHLPNHQTSLNILANKKIINTYPPIYDTNKNSVVSQYEETIFISDFI